MYYMNEQQQKEVNKVFSQARELLSKRC